MTTPTPTSDRVGPDLSTLSPPAGLPDVATLARLAGEFFAALPGQAPVSAAHSAGFQPTPNSLTSAPAATSVPAAGGVPFPDHVLPAGTGLPPQANGPQGPLFGGQAIPGVNVVPSTPQHAGAQVAKTPSLLPHSAAPNGLPDHFAIVPPAVDSRFGGQALGFDRVTAKSFGLPGDDELRALLASDSRSAAHSASHATPAASAAPADAATGYYFIEPQRNPHGVQGAVPNADATRHPPFDVNAIRRDFPILQERVNGRQLVWFDNAATTQKPQAVIDRISYFYEHENSNIHRAAHELAARATDAYEGARQKVQRFLNAASVDEIIFVRGATEAINLVAKTWGAANVGEGDEIIVSHLEHHANIVPWQQLAAAKGAKLRVIPVDDTGQVLLGEYQKLLSPRTKIVSVTQVSNALGTVVPVAEIVAMAHRAGAVALVDGAQSVSHMAVDVQALDADFFVFSGHKVFGPTGIGVVYGKKAILEDMPPWQGGGNMIADVSFERTVYHGPPTRFEAGTGNIADAVGLGAAIDYLERIGMENISRYEHALLAYATEALHQVPGLRLYGNAREKAGVLSFTLAGFESEEVGKALDREGIAVRAGHHCAQPILRRFGLESTVRASLALYNTCEDVDALVAALLKIRSGRGG